MGIRDKPTAPASPWQNGFAERLIGSIRRESVDYMIVLGEAHLRRNLISYAHYYKGFRTHRSLNKDAPISPSLWRYRRRASRAAQDQKPTPPPGTRPKLSLISLHFRHGSSVFVAI